jgi:hypothetical protein
MLDRFSKASLSSTYQAVKRFGKIQNKMKNKQT